MTIKSSLPTLPGQTRTITIYAEGGIIKSIDDIPPGIRVIVRDYYDDGSDEDAVEDEDGNLFRETVWE